VKQCQKTASFLIYTYRMEWIDKILTESVNRDSLEKSGYEVYNEFFDILRQLSEHFCLEKQYTHGIGLFLGYPLNDVVAFIWNKGKNSTCGGYWILANFEGSVAMEGLCFLCQTERRK